jgi:DNA-binding MarR family transcriptional regulator
MIGTHDPPTCKLLHIAAKTQSAPDKFSTCSVRFSFIIVKRSMQQFRNRERSPDGDGVELSPRDREDAARLLSLLLGKGEVEEQRRDMNLVQLAETIIEARRRRAEIFNPAMFGEPAWELLLTLFVMDREGPRLTIGRLAQLAGTKLTTALRWLEYLEDQAFVQREQHPNDARTAFIQLTDKAREALRLYLSGTPVVNL